METKSLKKEKKFYKKEQKKLRNVHLCIKNWRKELRDKNAGKGAKNEEIRLKMGSVNWFEFRRTYWYDRSSQVKDFRLW